MAFSYSQLSTYRTCPKQYEFAHVKKIPRQISAGESFGASVHNALKKFGEVEILSKEGVGGRELGVGQLQLFQHDTSPDTPRPTPNTLLQFWHSSFITEGYASKTDADAARKRGEKIMRHFFEWWSREQRDVLAVEKGFVLKDSGDSRESQESQESLVSPESQSTVITGRFDRVEKVPGGVRIVDYKTTAPREQENVDSDLQLSIYALAAEATLGLPCVELVLLFLREDGVTEVISKRSGADLLLARSVIKTLTDGISSKDFHPDPETGKCGRCPYRGICPAAL